MSDVRAAVFLEEMGIGPLWTLRDAAAVPAPDAADAPAAAAPMPAPVFAPIAPIGSAVRVAGAPAAASSSVAGPAAAPTPAQSVAPASAAAAASAGPRASADSGATPVAGGPATAAGAEAAWPQDDADAAPSAPSDDAIASMDWAQLRAAVAGCTRCSACRKGHAPLFGSGAQAARWVVVAGAVGSVDDQARQSVSGEPGKLLHNMLAAVELSREDNVYVTHLIKCRPSTAAGGDRAPTADEAAACRPYVEREIVLSGASLVLTLGQIAANGLLGKPLSEPVSASRGVLHTRGGAPLVATLHPGELLRRGSDKALAWADLCRARAADAADD